MHGGTLWFALRGTDTLVCSQRNCSFVVVTQISPSTLGGIPTLSRAFPGRDALPAPSFPPLSGLGSLPIQTSPNCPAPSFFSSSRDSRGISQASFSHGFWGLADTQGTVSFWQSPSLPSGTELRVSESGQLSASQRLPLRGSPARLAALATAPGGCHDQGHSQRAEHDQMPPLPFSSTGLGFQENPQQLFGESQKELSRPQRAQCTMTRVPGRQVHPAWGEALGRTYSCSGPPAPAAC